MPTKAEIVNQIETQIIPNLMEMITGGILQNVLLGMVDQINTLVGELGDLNTDDRSSIVNAINELVFNIQAIEDNLTPYVYFGLDDPNIVTPVGFGGDIPSFYVQQEHVGFDVVNVGFWTYTGIIGNEWVDLSLEDVGGIQSVQAGANINVDNTDPENPIISATIKEEFIELNDTPSSYNGQAGKVVAVKDNETGVEFIDNPNETLTLEQARQNGNVLEGEVILKEGAILVSEQNDDRSEWRLDETSLIMYFQTETHGYERGYYMGSSQFELFNENWTLGFYGDEITYTDNNDSNNSFSFQFPKGNLPDIVLPISTDGKFADENGNIELEHTIRLVLTPDDEDATTGDKMSFFADGDYEIISVNATAKTAPTGSAITIGLKVNGVDVTDVPITIPNGSKTSFSSTPAEFTATIELGDEITPNITAVGSTIKGKDVQLIFTYKKII